MQLIPNSFFPLLKSSRTFPTSAIHGLSSFSTPFLPLQHLSLDTTIDTSAPHYHWFYLSIICFSYWSWSLSSYISSFKFTILIVSLSSFVLGDIHKYPSARALHEQSVTALATCPSLVVLNRNYYHLAFLSKSIKRCLNAGLTWPWSFAARQGKGYQTIVGQSSRHLRSVQHFLPETIGLEELLRELFSSFLAPLTILESSKNIFSRSCSRRPAFLSQFW